MTKKEYYNLCHVHGTLFMITHYHNKNLTKSQCNDLENSLNTIDSLTKRYSDKRLKRTKKDYDSGVPYEEVIKKEFDL